TRNAACIASGPSRSRSWTNGSPPTASFGQRTLTVLKTTSTDGGSDDRRTAAHRPPTSGDPPRAQSARSARGSLAGTDGTRAASRMVSVRRDRERRALGGRRGDRLPIPAGASRPRDTGRRGAGGRRAERARVHLGRRHAAVRALA